MTNQRIWLRVHLIMIVFGYNVYMVTFCVVHDMVFLDWMKIGSHDKTCFVSLPEWSKGLRSGRNVFERVGSNPTADMTFSSSKTKMLRDASCQLLDC